MFGPLTRALGNASVTLKLFLKVKDVSEQTSAASQETAAASVELARLGADLQRWVGKFKV
ncbi:methyl-accepting chemotaxis protein [Pseudomonas gelidaquae]|uniref:methyl-accepting chemotaxis protein n=1 Tax=Pseudomonas sp. IB20 TaxID=1702250 RepID=UPI0012D2D025|nr:methyl-accepting chemotaxis protein [Pseudomonas sp. IB20]